MNAELEFEVPSWNKIYEMLLSLADRIRRDGFKPDIIIGISRGGWPPARVLSDLLDNPNLANVRAEFYFGLAETKGEPTITQPVSAKIRGKKVLIVDEVTDTGRSLKLVQEHISRRGPAQTKTATVYYKPWSIVKPDYYEKETNQWIVFPWDIKETVRRIVEKCRNSNKNCEKETAKLSEAGIPFKLIKKFLKEISDERKC